jgi:ATP-dependent Clp protease ATP-binding subunit ClpA
MNLDRYTQKAQEAIAGAQASAERLQSPVLDAEHLLLALVDDEAGSRPRPCAASASTSPGSAASSPRSLPGGRRWPAAS